MLVRSPMTWRQISTKLRDRRFLRGRLPWFVLSIAMTIGACMGACLQPPAPDPFEPTGDSGLSWLRYPIERNPHLRLLSISKDLYAVTFAADGQTGWAVGEYRTILKTIDGGETWEQRESLDRSPILNSVTFADDALVGWAVGWSGTIFKTTDGGDNWRPLNSTTSRILTSVTFTGDGGTGWAVGWDGTILKSGDGGESWAPRDSGTTNGLKSVTFTADGRTGWAVGQLGTILKTTNGGDDWTLRESPVSEDLNSVTFAADGQTGWAVGRFPNIPVDGAQPPTILKTVDGGETWEQRPFRDALTLYSVTFAGDRTTGWAVGGNGTILKTKDGGENWERKRSGTSVDLESVTFTGDGATGWAVGRSGTILKTKDGGETWYPRTRGASDDFESVTFAADGATGWIVGRNGTIIATNNGGATWTPRRINISEDTTSEDSSRDDITSNNLFSVTSASNGVSGWAAGVNGTILKTEDGGDSWMLRPSGVEHDFFTSVAFTDNGTTGWAVGWNGDVVRSTDAGESWTQAPERLPSFESVTSSVDGATAWAVGASGTIVKITDEGQTWERLESGTATWLGSVTFSADGSTGWVVGRRGTILKTVNGGQAWERRSTDTAADLSSVALASNGTTGLAVGSNGTILRTIDGDTWAPSNPGLPSALDSAYLTSVAFASDGVVGWAVGLDGVIVKTIDGGMTWFSSPKDYHKLPARWTWIVFMMGALAPLPALRRLPAPSPATNVADEFVSDRPIRTGEDALQREPIANALSDVLRNPASEPPLTVAITGDWGQGKSSLMNLVKENLQEHNYKAVWFNAWHHQKERHMFASLMQSICEQAVPSLFTRPGLRFYGRLILRRLIRHPFWTVLLLILSVLCLVLWMRANWLFDVIELLPGLDRIDALKDRNIVLSVILFLTSFPYPAWKAFVPDLKRVKPGYLIAAAAKAVRPKTFGDQLGFRHRFREALREVVEAMKPYRMVIIIDDLDRCRPEHVVDTLEAINYLADAGDCYVVMGIAREQVIRCVGLRFKEIAHEVSVVSSDGGRNSDSKGDTGRLKRADYARQYLEKIINLEVRIPKASEGDMTAFITKLRHRSTAPAKTGGDAGVLGKIIQYITFFVSVIVLLVALVFVVGSLTLPSSDDATSDDATSGGPEPPSSRSPPTSMITISETVVEVPEGSSEDYTVVLEEQPSHLVMITAVRNEGDPDLNVTTGRLTFTPENWNIAQTVTISAAADTDAKNGVSTIEHSVESEDLRFHASQVLSVQATESDNDPSDPPPFPPPPFPPPSTMVPRETWLITLVAIAVLFYVTYEYLLRREEDHARDSPEFERALQIWHPVVRARTDSPRQFKRFVNRVRFLAALLRNRWRTEDPKAVPGDSLMVALAALQSVRHGTESDDAVQPIPHYVVAGLSDAQPLSEGANPYFRGWIHDNIRKVALEIPQDRQAFCDNIIEEIKKAIEAHQASGEQATEEKIERYNTVAGLV